MLRYLRRNNSLGDRIGTVAGRGRALFDRVSRAVCRDGGSFGETGPIAAPTRVGRPESDPGCQGRRVRACGAA